MVNLETSCARDSLCTVPTAALVLAIRNCSPRRMTSKKPSILIVDDEDGIRSLLEVSFMNGGYEVRTAKDGLEAVKLCESNAFDAVLSDVRMPGLSGHELARWLADARPAIRFFMMTGWDSGCEDCPIAGRCVLLTKPFYPKDAVAIVDAGIACHRNSAA